LGSILVALHGLRSSPTLGQHAASDLSLGIIRPKLASDRPKDFPHFVQQPFQLHAASNRCDKRQPWAVWPRQGRNPIWGKGRDSALAASCCARDGISRGIACTFGGPAVVGCEALRPEALRPRLSTGLPLSFCSTTSHCGLQCQYNLTGSIREHLLTTSHRGSQDQQIATQVSAGTQIGDACRASSDLGHRTGHPLLAVRRKESLAREPRQLRRLQKVASVLSPCTPEPAPTVERPCGHASYDALFLSTRCFEVEGNPAAILRMQLIVPRAQSVPK
jgi:hypothetical protein